MDKAAALKRYFGHDRFREGQEALIDASLAGRDAVGIMPTGGGKSLCYQIPALLLPGITVVISPLISLMKDQVAALKTMGIPAAFLNSTLTSEQLRLAYRRMGEGAYKLVYVAPERLETREFTAAVSRRPISLVAVDEAHCVSQWGQDFRPSYLKIADFVDALPRRPAVAAFTATATDKVREDIIRLLRLKDPAVTVTGFDRANLFFEVRQPRDKLAETLALVRGYGGKSGIIYCATRSAVERVCQVLRDKGVAATRYHAGLEEAERRANQDDFQFDRANVMVATNAFGMGIDKSNVRFVLHYNMPKSLEAYYQEAGRAGRDGGEADCVLLFSTRDVQTARFLIEQGSNPDLTQEELDQVRERDYLRLQVMTDYCKTRSCLRGYLLDYFGQAHGEVCGSCGNCRARYEHKDVTVPAQMALSCVVRMKERLGYYVGKGLVAQVLHGSKSKRLQTLGLNALTTYGLLNRWSEREVGELLDFLELEGYLKTVPPHFVLVETPAAAAVLFGGKKLSMPVRKRPKPVSQRLRPDRGGGLATPEEEELFAVLKALRTQIAQREGVPAYVVFSDAALTDMVRKAPRTMEEFLEVSGVGNVKARRYGERFLKAIAERR